MRSSSATSTTRRSRSPTPRRVRSASLGVPSISPNQGNNPAFIVGNIAATAPVIADTTTYILPLATMGMWGKLYSFNAEYGLSAYDVPNLLKLDTQIASEPAVRAQFFVNYNSASTTATPNAGQVAVVLVRAHEPDAATVRGVRREDTALSATASRADGDRHEQDVAGLVGDSRRARPGGDRPHRVGRRRCPSPRRRSRRRWRNRPSRETR